MNVQPTLDRVVVRTPDPQEISEGGIVLPKGAQQKKSSSGTVLMTGPDTKGIAIGDEVLFAKYAGTEFEMGEGRFLIMESKEILGIIRLNGKPKK